MASTDTKKPEQFELLSTDATKKQEKAAEAKDEIYNSDSKDILCGFWIFRGAFLQKFANETAYIILYGVMGALISMTFSYSNGTITSIEKRFKIPSKVSGIISVGNDISQMIAAGFVGYYGSRGHRPRLMGFGLLTIVGFCLLTASLHLVYGPGDEALKLTKEFADGNITQAVVKKGKLCSKELPTCVIEEFGNLLPPILLFLAQFISGIGSAMFYTLGVTYMDDNTKRSKTAAMLSSSTFVRMLGPACGYALVAFCLRIFVAPELTPIINDTDPRWLGAWWLGWIVLAVLTFVCSLMLAMFPKEMPSAKARRLKSGVAKHPKLSFSDMKVTLKRLLRNKLYVFNTLGTTFYFFGYIVYWMFLPKYIEIQYRQSAANSSMVNGTLAFAFSAAGVLISGFVVSKFKPSGRMITAWNALVDLLTVACSVAYMFIGCPGTDNMLVSRSIESLQCATSCHCDYVQYSPVCGQDNLTYISPCHAGCTDMQTDAGGHKSYENCMCIGNNSISNSSANVFNSTFSSTAQDGACPVDCFPQFMTFLVVMCMAKFIGASARSTGLLISLRIVPSKDKTVSMGMGMMVISLVAFVPAPIFYGWLMDRSCLVWGKNCSSKANCWLYDTKALRHSTNLSAAVIIFLGFLCNIVVFCYSKNLNIFDEEHAIEAEKNEKERLNSKQNDEPNKDKDENDTDLNILNSVPM